MKVVLMLFAGFSIGAILAVAAIQLVRALYLELSAFFSEAWHSADTR
ncbi:hypothetical protein ACQE3E_16605 [Methylomonas sp. MED-D]|nr:MULTISPECIES: hypothetical protein [Methylomonas]MDT4331020.1 hypothetical protein [Methylomonas sp. MV1]NJA04977.1 hypothetical protein [Methylococcaceae bacterium WWC4]WGS84824.1 hypothetical protein QC632_17430 [Methylomonas sp. UP202]